MAQSIGAGLAGVGRDGASSLFALYDAVDKNVHSGDFEQTWADSSGNSRDATRTTQPGTTGGWDGTAIPQFTREGLLFSDVANCCFAVTRTGGYQMIQGGQTILATIRTTNSDSSADYPGDPAACIVGDSSGSVAHGFGLHDGKIRYCAYDSQWYQYDSTSTVNDDKWHQIAITKQAGNLSELTFYIDGEVDRIIAGAHSYVTWHFNSIGRGYDIDDRYTGYLRNVAIWNNALTSAEIQDIWNAQGGFDGDGRGPYLIANRNPTVTAPGLPTTTGPWDNGTSEDPRPSKGARFFLGFKYRQIINYAYTLCGYKSQSPWKSVHKTQASTDQTANLGDKVGTPASYTSGGCSLKLAFMWGASTSHPGTSTNTTCMNMFTDTEYTPTSAMHMVQSRNDCGTVFKEHDFAWISGGGSSNVDKFNYHNESMATSSISGGINSNSDQAACSGFSDQHYGYWWVNYSGSPNGQKVTFATDSFASGSHWANNGQQKGISSKVRKGMGGNEGSYNGGNNLRKWNLVTDTNYGTSAKPQTNCGEENFTMGQDHQYMLGNYDGAQNNENWKFYYATDTGTANVAGLSPTAHAGQSSGHCSWRE